jgi:hypothetical protein
VSWNDHVDLAALGGTAGEVPVHDSVTAHGAHMSGWRSIHSPGDGAHSCLAA